MRSGSAEAGGVEAATTQAELMAVLRSQGVASVSPNGVLGDPAGASADAGHRLLDAWTSDLLADLDGWP